MNIARNKNVWFGLVTLAFGLWALWQSVGFDAASRDYPIAVSALIAICGALIAFNAAMAGLASADDVDTLMRDLAGVGPVIALVIGWGILLEYGAGYLASSLLMVFGTILLLRRGAPLRALLFAVLITAAVFGLFEIVFDVPLPRNPLFE